MTTATTPAPRGRIRSHDPHHNGPVFWIGMLILVFIFAVPLLWMFVTSIKTIAESRFEKCRQNHSIRSA